MSANGVLSSLLDMPCDAVHHDVHPQRWPAMPQMIRKQFYIETRQEFLLKRLAKELGMTEAELIRQGLDQVLQAGVTIAPELEAWERERAFIKRWTQKGKVKGKRTGRREDLYDRPLSR